MHFYWGKKTVCQRCLSKPENIGTLKHMVSGQSGNQQGWLKKTDDEGICVVRYIGMVTYILEFYLVKLYWNYYIHIYVIKKVRLQVLQIITSTPHCKVTYRIVRVKRQGTVSGTVVNKWMSEKPFHKLKTN